MADNVKKDIAKDTGVVEPNLYLLLEVTPISSFEEIHKSYRALSKKYHPDLCEDKELGAKKMKEIVAAFNQLKDKNSRDLYDNKKMFQFKSYRKDRSGMKEEPKGFFAKLFYKKPDEKELKKLAKMGENFAMAVSLAKTKSANGISDARDMFNNLLKLQPKNPDLYFNLWLTFYFSGDIDNAKISFQNALKLDPNFKEASDILQSFKI